MLGVVDVKRREQRKNIGLNAGDEDFERADGNHENKAWRGHQKTGADTAVHSINHEARKHFQKHVTSHHRNKQTQCEAERTDEEGEQLDHEDRGHHDRRSAVGHKQREEFDAVLPETDKQYD